MIDRKIDRKEGRKATDARKKGRKERKEGRKERIRKERNG